MIHEPRWQHHCHSWLHICKPFQVSSDVHVSLWKAWHHWRLKLSMIAAVSIFLPQNQTWQMPIIANFSLLFVMCHARQEQRERSCCPWEHPVIVGLRDCISFLCRISYLPSTQCRGGVMMCLSQPLYCINKEYPIIHWEKILNGWIFTLIIVFILLSIQEKMSSLWLTQ